METFFAIVGTIFSIGIVLTFFIWGVGYVVEQINKLIERYDWKIAESERRKAGVSIVRQAYWMDKTDDSYFVLLALGEWMRDNPDCSVDMGRIRDLAREKQRKAKEENE